MNRCALLLDGGYVLKRLAALNKRPPIADDVVFLCQKLRADPELQDYSLLRIYFYDAPPAHLDLIHPMTGARLRLENTLIHSNSIKLQEDIECSSDFALRRGELHVRGWRLGDRALRNLLKTNRPLEPMDLVPNITQKGVDLRIGLDVAQLALRQLVDAIVLVTGDADMIPVLKFARREGLRVLLYTMGGQATRALRAQADRVLSIP